MSVQWAEPVTGSSKMASVGKNARETKSQPGPGAETIMPKDGRSCSRDHTGWHWATC